MRRDPPLSRVGGFRPSSGAWVTVKRMSGLAKYQPGGAAPSTGRRGDSREAVRLDYTKSGIRLNDAEALADLVGLPPGLPHLGQSRTSIGIEPRVRRNRATGECREEGECWIVGTTGAARIIVSRPLRETAGRKFTPAGPWASSLSGSWRLSDPKENTHEETVGTSDSGSAPTGTGAALDGSQEFLALPADVRGMVERQIPYADADLTIARAVMYNQTRERVTYLRRGNGRIVTVDASRPHGPTGPSGPFRSSLFAARIDGTGAQPALGTSPKRQLSG